MRSLKLFAVASLGLVAGACASVEEQRAADEGRCRSYGFRRGTDAFSRCLLDVDLDRSASRRSNFFMMGPGFYGPRRWGYYW
ncbi:MAG: hypothetical protein N2444_00920 [Methylocystis sp.]|nr:hypothetical protein [Methylocystis sp.]